MLRRGGQVVRALADDVAEGGQPHGRPAQGDQVPGSGVGGVFGRPGQPVEVGEVGAAHAQRPGRGVHLPDEGAPAGPVGAGQGKGGVVAGGQKHALEQLARGENVPGDQARAAPVVLLHVGDHGLRDPDRPVQVAGADHHQRGHDLRDAGHRPLGVQAAAPQPPSRRRVDQVGACGLDAGRAAGRGRHQPRRRRGHPRGGSLRGAGQNRGHDAPGDGRRDGPGDQQTLRAHGTLRHVGEADRVLVILIPRGAPWAEAGRARASGRRPVGLPARPDGRPAGRPACRPCSPACLTA